MTDPTDASKPKKPEEQPAWSRLHVWQITAVRDVFWIGLAVLVLWLGNELSSIVTPVLVALAMAYLFHPLITFCEHRWHMRRPLTISIILSVLILVLLGVVAWLVPMLVNQIGDLAQATPGYVENVRAFAQSKGVNLGDMEQLSALADQVREDPMSWLAGLFKYILVGTGTAVNVIGAIIGETIYLTMTLVLIPIYFFFFAWQFGPLVRRFEHYLPLSTRDQWLDIVRQMDQTISTYFRDRVAIALIMSVMFCTVWSPMVSDVPYWFVLGLLAGMFSLIPYASFLVWPVALGLKYLQVTTGTEAPDFEWLPVVVGPSVAYLAVQFFESWVLTPYIQSKNMEMSVVTIIIVMLVGGALGGLYGLLLCIPVAACGRILLNEVYLPRLKKWAQEN